jgi:sulfate adenylyltransferase (ADP) / adenylylsulfatase
MGLCFSTASSKGAEYDSFGNLKSCIFCTIANHSSRELIFEDEICAVFYPLDLCAKVHILIVPKLHVKSIQSNRKLDLELIRHLKLIGDQVLDRYGNSDRMFMFHLEPYNSIEHLHMHGLVKPLNVLGRIKFTEHVQKWSASYEDIVGKE